MPRACCPSVYVYHACPRGRRLLRELHTRIGLFSLAAAVFPNQTVFTTMYNTFFTSISLTIFLALQYGTGAAGYYTTMFSAGNGHWEGFAKMNWMFAL